MDGEGEKAKRIILIDDETDYSATMAFWFKSKGYQVEAIVSIEEAITKIKADPPDVVFVDMIMPDSDGITVIKRIREFNEKIPLIIMSSYIEDRRIEKTVNLYGTTGAFYKGDDFAGALKLLELGSRPKGDNASAS